MKTPLMGPQALIGWQKQKSLANIAKARRPARVPTYLPRDSLSFKIGLKAILYDNLHDSEIMIRYMWLLSYGVNPYGEHEVLAIWWISKLFAFCFERVVLGRETLSRLGLGRNHNNKKENGGTKGEGVSFGFYHGNRNINSTRCG